MRATLAISAGLVGGVILFGTDPSYAGSKRALDGGTARCVDVHRSGFVNCPPTVTSSIVSTRRHRRGDGGSV